MLMHTSSTSSIDSKSIEIIKDKLYWISDFQPPRNHHNAFFFNIDKELVYEPFSSDFGPLNMGMTYRFVTELEKMLRNPTYNNSRIYHYTSTDNTKRTNAACLMGAFQVIHLGKTAEEAWLPFTQVQPPLAEYRDASYADSPYRCSILDCLRGLEYAMKLKWFDMKLFNLRDYEHFEKVDNGDLNWIIPGKFVAFSGPSGAKKDANGYLRFTPDDYVPIFKKMGVTMVVRLNNKQYDENRFKDNGIKHKDLIFPDGSCPSDDIIAEFLRVCEQEKGAIAVHCKAGLGRTGSLIAAYAMKHYKFNAADFIGYIRLCRPGSVLGPQQQFLVDKQDSFHQMSEVSPIYKSISYLVRDFHVRRETLARQNAGSPLFQKKKTEMTAMDKNIAVYGDYGQANRLLDAKHKTRSAMSLSVGHFEPKVSHEGYKVFAPETVGSPVYSRASPVYTVNSPVYTTTFYRTAGGNWRY